MTTRLKGLYAITDPVLMGKDLIAMSTQAISGGISILQYRNKTANKEQQFYEAASLAELCKKYNVIFIINDDVELAIKVDADGVHLGQKDLSLSSARELIGENKIIGVSCNNQLSLAKDAEKNGADYIAFGRFFTSQTKPEAPQAELNLLSRARKIIKCPVVAIGGITPENAPYLINEGADMLAVINSIFGHKDIRGATQQLVEIIQRLNTP